MFIQRSKLYVRLFAQSYISTQIRWENMDEFVSRETINYPCGINVRVGEML